MEVPLVYPNSAVGQRWNALVLLPCAFHLVLAHLPCWDEHGAPTVMDSCYIIHHGLRCMRVAEDELIEDADAILMCLIVGMYQQIDVDKSR